MPPKITPKILHPKFFKIMRPPSPPLAGRLYKGPPACIRVQSSVDSRRVNIVACYIVVRQFCY